MNGKRIMIAGAVLLAAAVPIACSAVNPIATPVAVHAQARIGGEIPFDLFRGNRIVVRGTLNGRPIDMILDTGAGVTTLDRAFARSIGLKGGRTIEAQGAGGSVAGELFQNVSIELGPVALSGATVLVLDLAPVARALGRPMPVVLGREFFMSSVVSIDFERRRLTVSNPAGFVAPAGASEVPLGRDGLMHTMKVSLAGLPPVVADLDLGNGGTLIASHAYWRGIETLGRLPYAPAEAGGVGGMLPTRKVVLPSVSFGGHAFTSVPAELSDHPNALPERGINIGIDMFRPFDVTLDLGRDRLFLKRNSWKGPWAKDRAGMRSELVGDKLRVANISRGSPADRAGIKEGDDFVAVNGVAVSDDYYLAGRHGWSRGPAGSEVTLTRADGTTLKLTLADYY